MLDLSPQQDELRELQGHLTILKVGLLLVVALLAIRLWHLQVREGQYYRDLSENNRTRSVILEPARGLIYDRNGVLLANNVPSFNLYVTLEDVTDREALIKRLVGLIGLDEASLRKRLSERGAKLLARKLKGGLTLREAALIESHRLDLPGVMVQAESQRNYPARLTASHLLGYVGEVSADQLEKPEFGGLHQGSVVGQYGVEHTYDRPVAACRGGHAGGAGARCRNSRRRPRHDDPVLRQLSVRSASVQGLESRRARHDGREPGDRRLLRCVFLYDWTAHGHRGHCLLRHPVRPGP